MLIDVARATDDKQSVRIGLTGLGWIALSQGDYRLAEPALEEALAVASELDESFARGVALQYLGWLAIGRGEHVQAREALEAALALFRDPDHPELAAIPLVLLADLALAEGDRRGARRLYEEVLRLRRSPNVPRVPALVGMGVLASEDGDLSAAGRLFEEALEVARADGDKGGMAAALHGLGALARGEGEVKRAAQLYCQALELGLEAGQVPRLVEMLEAIAGLDPAAGGYEHSARLFGAAQALRERNGYARAPWRSARYEADVALVREALGLEAFGAVHSEGAALSIEDAVSEAFRRHRRRGRPITGWSSLTQTEQQLTALVAEGLTNAEIADRLFVSPWTVKEHVSRIFAKVGVASRRELAREFGLRAGHGRGGDR